LPVFRAFFGKKWQKNGIFAGFFAMEMGSNPDQEGAETATLQITSSFPAASL
jgi:hypothetical protein